MKNYFCVVSYLGAAYFGFERQKNHPTIQGKIEECLFAILQEKITINASGRTDAKVNARGQTFSFLSDSPLLDDKEKFLYAINRVLPSDIVILSIKEVDPSFHARYSAIEKMYSYSFHIGEKDPFLSFKVAMLGNREFDYLSFKKACLLFLGTHNFQDFTPKNNDNKSFIRNISKIDFVDDNYTFTVNFVGDGFMTYQIRTMVGAALKIGFKRMNLDELKTRIDNNERKILSFKAPPEGLSLEKVFY